MKKLFLLLSMSTAAVAAAPSVSSAKLVLDLPPILAGKSADGCKLDSDCGSGYCCNSKCQATACITACGLDSDCGSGYCCNNKCQQNQCVTASGLLNDTGITWSGIGATGNNTGTTCSDAAQDCSYGWDRTDGSNATDGHAGFKFTKLDSSGSGPATGTYECVRDERTGLIWEVKTPSTATSNWSGAKTTATSFSACGKTSGWRLPTVKELLSIVSYHDISPGPAIDVNYFPTAPFLYWTSKESASDGSKAWAVHFGISTNQTIPSNKTDSYRLRLVHD